MYIVIELQTNASGQVANIVSTYDTRAQADNKYHTILAAAAVSSVPVHAATMINEEGYPIQCYAYHHD